MLTREALQAWYGSQKPDLSWLEKPSRHQFRWRLHNNRWVTGSRQFSSAETVQKILTTHGPRDVYIGTSAWLTPLNLPKRAEVERSPPILLDHLVVFDIDERPFCYRRLERARKAAQGLLEWLEEHEDLTLLCISYSGGKGFHLILKDNDRSLFSIPEPREREDAVRASRKALLDRVLAAGFPVDTTVTSDTRRIIRLPGSLHGTTGWCCTRLTRQQLAQPLKRWVHQLPRHPQATQLPYWPYGIRSVLFGAMNATLRLVQPRRNPSKTNPQEQPAPTTTTMQISTQVVGTRGRSAFLAWVPPRWSDGQLDAVSQRLHTLGWGPVHQFVSSGRTLLVAPRALPTEQLQKALRGMGWPSLSSEMKRLGHAWVDASPAKVEGKVIEEEFHYEGIWTAAGEGNASIPWSATHLELLKRWGVQPAQIDGDVAGRAEPALRMVSKV